LAVAQYVKQHFGRAALIRVDTNGQGYILNPDREVAAELKAAGVNKVSVSLNAENKQVYNEVCKPTYADAYEQVLHFIMQAKKAQLQVEARAVRIPEINIEATKAVAEKLSVNFRVREYIPCFF
jgi:GTP 3',8-cyclase